MKKNLQPKKLLVNLETVRELDTRALPAIAGGLRPVRGYTAASHQDVCCA